MPLIACPSIKLSISTPTRLDKCILYQTKTRSYYLLSGETGRARIVSLGKEDGSDDSQAKRVIDLSGARDGNYEIPFIDVLVSFVVQIARL